MLKVLHILGLTLLVAVSFSAAEVGDPAGPITLDFKTIPIDIAPLAAHKVTPYRLMDKITVTVWDPVVCGQKPVNPEFSIDQNQLKISYSLTGEGKGAKRCTIVSQFDINNAPHRDFEVHFAGGPEPYVVAKMKKCPFYKPSSDDVWECLVTEN